MPAPAPSAVRSTPANPPRRVSTRNSIRCRRSARPALPANATKAGYASPTPMMTAGSPAPRCRKAVAAQLLGDRLDFPGRDPLHVHLRQPLRTLVSYEQLGREPSGSVLRNPQLEFADPRDQRPAIIARPVALPARRPFALLGAQGLRHLRFKHLLERHPHQSPAEIPRPPP